MEVTPVNILIIDDEPDHLLALEAILENPSYQLVRAGSALKALDELEKRDFALLILDVRMPDISGVELASKIWRLQGNDSVPIVFLSAERREPSDLLAGYCARAVDYILKPVDPRILRSKVARFVEMYQQKVQLKAANLALLAEAALRERRDAELKLTFERQVKVNAQHVRARLNLLATVDLEMAAPLAAVNKNFARLTAILTRRFLSRADWISSVHCAPANALRAYLRT